MRIPASLLILALLGTPLAARAPSMEKMLAGRTPGKPQGCIMQSQIDDSTIFDQGAILYHMKGGPDYLNTPTPRCPSLRSDSFIVSHTYSNQLCRGDILQVHDQASGMDFGGCPLGDFVPYARVKTPKPQ
ncbi:hypothetical protein [Sphingomonas abietis]|uniref:DUF1496 domain-containing protein n=1 Tax=Sphingomonas abietis TaxID=3012344 RepID=A0ABY7NRM7_9SPHN|nr:hypothetical protein [Sphingomonas abietis]WBO22619.1 hypothetical protein PBT88_00225 [Sphingomonas abietis]